MVLIVTTALARLIDAWPASTHEIDALKALAATNGAARSFVASSLSADDSPTTKQVRQWRARVEAIEGTRVRGVVNASSRWARGVAQGPETGAQFR
ncbi:hypothetical protein [Trinickia diaoshuihuensis]|uniref:hypothetical protein n=1 Tax=Trinickia diaoshuihuensis TaxID=2292265 RepID=UPI0013C332B0|nr:hypothetical protein [Trinickia diaoshuihuensis]